MLINRWLPTLRRELRSSLAEAAYIGTGVDFTKPAIVNAKITKRCNLRCPMCLDWRDREYSDQEMSTDEWKRVLGELGDFLGKYRVSFIGGEPFVRKDFIDLLEYCAKHGIEHGTTTNGSFLSEQVVKRIVSTRPLLFNVSIDGVDASTHDSSRGMEGSFLRAENGIKLLTRERRLQGIDFPVRVKTVVHAWNFRQLPKFVAWAESVGADSVDFFPVRRWAPDVTSRGMWIKESDIKELDSVIDQLQEAKKAGAAIETSQHRLGELREHFLGAPPNPELSTCRAGLRRFSIMPNGDVETCWPFPAIGNLRQATPREIWLSEQAKQNREKTITCTKACDNQCLAKLPLLSMVRSGQQLLRSSRRRMLRPSHDNNIIEV